MAWCGVICPPYDWLNKGYSFYMAAVITLSVMGVALELKHVIETNLIRVSYHCISCYFHLTFLLNGCTQATRWRALVIKVGVVDVYVHVLSHLKEELA